jgi:ABC-type uncharacterized transport system permease subunit
MIPAIDQMLFGQCLDVGEIHDHAVCRIAVTADDITGKRNLNRITVAVQMPALALVIRYTVTGIKLKAAGDKHRKNRQKIG